MNQKDNDSIIQKLSEELADKLELDSAAQTGLDETEQDQINHLRTISQIAGIHRSQQRQYHNNESPEPATEKTALFSWGRLTVKQQMGVGAFGEVYRAHDDILDRDVALKLLKSDSSGPLKSHTFIEEAKRMAKVRHPNVLAIHGANIHEGRAGFWADLIDGQTIDQTEEYGKATYDMLFSFTRQVTQGLQAIHEKQLIHGDIKPANIIQDEHGHFIIMDFGAGLSISESQELSNHVSGTPALMAPELFNGQHSGTATDIYALGASLFKLASGRYPVPGDDLIAIQENHNKQNYRLLKDLRPDLNRSFTALVQSMVSPDPVKRPDTHKVLRRLYDIESAPQRRRNKIALWSIIALLLIGTGVSSWGFYQANQAKNQAVLAQQQTESINEFLQDMLSAGSQLGGGRDVRVADVLDQAAEQLSTEPPANKEVAIAIHQSLADSYNAIRDNDKALKHADLSVQLAEELYPPDSLPVVRGRLEIVQALQLLNQHQQSIDLANQTIEEAAETLGDDHWYIQRARKHIINNHYSLGQYDQGIALLDNFFKTIPDPKTANNNFGYEILQAKANGMFVKGRFAETIEAATQAIDWLQAYPNKNLMNEASITELLAIAQLESGLQEPGIANLNKALTITRKVHGEQSQPYLNILVNLGAAQQNIKHYKLAKQTTLQAYNLAKKLYPDNPNRFTVIIGINLGGTLIELGEIDEGEVILREALETAYQVLGENRPETLVVEYHLAEALIKQGQYKEAQEWTTSTHEKMLEVFGEDHFYTLLSQDNQAISFSAQNQHKKALAMHQEVVSRMTDKMGARQRYSLVVRQHQVDSLMAAQAMQRLNELLPHLVDDLTAVYGADDPDTQHYQSLLDSL